MSKGRPKSPESITEAEIAVALRRGDKGLEAARGRWSRSKKDWADRQMLVDDVLRAVGHPNAGAEDRVAVFYAIKTAFASKASKHV